MRKIFLAAGLTAALASTLSAAALEEADKFYQQGAHSKAVEAYQALLRDKPRSAFLHYNLANAYFKEATPGDLGRAIAEYLRAYRIRPRDHDIRHNLDFALKKAGESLVPPGTPGALHYLFNVLSPDELLGLQWLGYWACLLLGSAWLLKDDRRAGLQPWLLGALAFWAAAGSWWGIRELTDISAPGVILEQNAEARSGPGNKFPVSFNAPEGRRVSILSESGEWLEVGVLKEGLKGWVPAKAVEKI